MARKIKYLASLQGHDFKKYMRTEKAPDVLLRLLALAHIQDGKTCRTTAAMLKVDESAVQKWVQRFAAGSVEGLRRRSGQGCRKRVAIDLLPEIKNGILELQPAHYGERIRGKDIQAFLEAKWNISYKISAVYKLLQDLGIVWISARSKHPASNQQAQDAFKKTFKKK